MRLIVGIVIGYVYLTIGYVVTSVIGAIEREDIGEEIESVGVWMMWPCLIGIYMLMKLIPWVGRKVAKIPVMIIVVVRGIKNAKTEHNGESGKDR